MFKALKEKLSKLLGKKEEKEKVVEVKIDDEKTKKKLEEDIKSKPKVKKEEIEKVDEKEEEVKEEVKEEPKEEKKEEPKEEEKVEEKQEVKEEPTDTQASKKEEPKAEVEKDIDINKKEEIQVKVDKEEELIEENKEELEHAIDTVKESLEPTKKPGFFQKLTGRIGTVILNQETFNEFFEELESLLLENNVSLKVVDKIRTEMEQKLLNLEIKKSKIEEEIRMALKETISDLLLEPFDIIKQINEKKSGPFVILFFGINGSGKTTTISKLAYLLKEHKIPCVLGAGDTFRAASIEQLQKHGEKLGIKVISQDYGSDPAAVAFDTVAYAKSKGLKAVLIDTAGRMHTKSDLIREMEKIIRVVKPDLKIFVAESITGNDATEQALTFNKSFGIDGTILTKADVDERGGTPISIGYITNKPILFLGTGQGYKDLEPFSKEEILANLGLE